MANYMDAVNGSHNGGCEVNCSDMWVGAYVIASPKNGDFEHEFQGRVVGNKKGMWQVEDQEGNVFDCKLDQLELD